MSIRNKLLDNRRELSILSSGQMELIFLPSLACRAGAAGKPLFTKSILTLEYLP